MKSRARDEDTARSRTASPRARESNFHRLTRLTVVSMSVRILVVDDDLELTDVLAAMLRHHGHEVETAGDGTAALVIAAASHFDSVLLDLTLPDFDGFEVAQRLRAGLIDASIIVITGTPTRTLENADAVGVDLLLDKPVASEHLAGLVEYITRWRRASGPPPRCLNWA
jgi:CheY-like chemotaxis protein